MPSPGAILLIGIVLAIMIAYTSWHALMPMALLGILLALGVAWLAIDYWVRAPRETWLPPKPGTAENDDAPDDSPRGHTRGTSADPDRDTP